MTLKDFYQEFYNSDPYALVDAAAAELAELAVDAGIDWHATSHAIRLVNGAGKESKFGVYNGKTPITLQGTKKGSADFFSRVEVVRDLRVPHINFVRHGKDAGVWRGFSFLCDKYKEYRERNGSAARITPLEEQRRAEQRRKLEEKKAQREAALRREALIQSQQQHARLASYLTFSADFENAPAEDGTFPYAVKKQISGVFASCNVRRMLDWDRGHNRKTEQILAIPLAHLDGRYNGQIVSWQRINAEGGKFQTAAVEGLEYAGACHVIGSLKNAKRVCVVEGFATGASVWMADRSRFDAVVVAISANNMKPVVEQLANVYEAVKIWCALDNDQLSAQKGKGNTGLLAGLEIQRQFPGVVCTRPAFTTGEIALKFSDYNDLHTAHGLTEVMRQIASKENRLKAANDLDAELMKLALMERVDKSNNMSKKFMRQLMRCVDVGMKSCPAVLSPRELIHLIGDKMEELQGDRSLMKNVKSRIERQFAEKCHKAQSFRSFSTRITDRSVRPDHITYKYFNTPAITPEVLEYIESLDGPVIVRAGMGSGKSKHLLRPMMHAATRGVSVAHRVTLIGGLWDMMTRDDNNQRTACDILHYQDPGYQDMAPYASKLTICINSIVKGCWQPLMKNHDFFGLDEATQGLRAILSGRAMENPTYVFNQLIDSIARTEENAVLVDADASDILVDLCQLALKRREKMGLPGWTQIHVIELPVDVTYREAADADPKKRRVLYTDKDRIVTEALKAVAKGEKFLMATDSTAFAEQMLLKLQEQWPEKRWLYVSQDTKPNADVVAFTDAPNQQAPLYDGLIYSPAISSGVSIETPHFTRHFGMFCGQVVPSDAIQMLRRDRTATEFLVGLAQLPGYREEDENNIRRGTVKAVLETATLNNEFTDAKIVGDELHLGLADTHYARLKFRVAGMEATARNEFANNLICILFSDGYDVEHLAVDADASALGKEVRKDAKEKHWELTLQRHFEAETPDEQLRDELNQKRSLSAEEDAQLTRWDIEHELKQEVTEDSLKFIKGGGMKKLGLAELMTMDEITAAKIDREQQLINFAYQFSRGSRTEQVYVVALSQEQADQQFALLQPGVTRFSVTSKPAVEVTQRTFASLHRRALRQYFETCGINPDTGEGETSQEAMNSAMQQLLDPENIDVFNNVLRFGGYSSKKGKPKQPAAVFKQICEAVGFEAAKRRQTRSEGLKYVWSVSPESFAFVSDVLARRAQDGQTFFALKSEQNVPAKGDLDFSVDIYMDQKSGSPDLPATAGFAAVEEAITNTPVPFAWVRNVLTGTELAQLAAMPLRLIRATLSGLYLAENMGSLDNGCYEELKRLQAG